MMQVTCRDNGQGMHHKDIPNMLGRVLSGTKYGVKQTRGKFGLGAKMALLWYVLSDPAALSPTRFHLPCVQSQRSVTTRARRTQGLMRAGASGPR